MDSTSTEILGEAIHDKTETYLDTAGDIEAYFARLEREAAGRHGRIVDSIDSGSGIPGAEWCAVDTEADSMHSYESKLCLIQFAYGREMAIIDPLAVKVEDLQPFNLFLQGRTVWMHGADYDMAMFRKTFGVIPERVWDTQTAARLTGSRQFGLAALIAQEFGVELSKQSQKADWGKRPLTPRMLSYAYNDVRYILELAGLLYRRLEEHGRLDWFTESCTAARDTVTAREEGVEDPWRISGWGKLSRRGLMYLRELWMWRDEECRQLDRPAFKLLGNQQLLHMVNALDAGERVEPPKFLRPRQARSLIEAIANARRVPEKDWPVKRRPAKGERLDIDEEKFNAIRDHRNRVAEALDIDGTLIASRSVIERLAADIPGAEDALLDWQRTLLFETDVRASSAVSGE